jgi:hypothetical protein
MSLSFDSMRLRAGFVLALLFLPSRTFGQVAAGVSNDVAVPVPSVSMELLDPQGLTRAHVVTRAILTEGADVQRWSFEARANVRIIRGLSLSAVLPFGLLVPGPGAENQFFFGNLEVGVAGGGQLLIGGVDEPSFALGGALDIYAPTAKEPAPSQLELASAQAAIASMRAYEPQLYLSNTMSFRTRLLGRFRISMFTAELELGVVPGFSLDSRSDFSMLFGAGARFSVLPIRSVEPFLELGGTVQVSGPGELSPPFLVTPGVRFHISDTLDPAIFVSFNFVDSGAVILGIDLAGALRPSVRGGDDVEDFFDGF